MARRPILEYWHASRGQLSPQKPRLPWSYPVLAHLSVGYPGLGGRLPTCYSPVRRFTRGLLPFLARLACVRHAASVRSEPGSNSPVELEKCVRAVARPHQFATARANPWSARRKNRAVRLSLRMDPFRTSAVGTRALLFSFQRPGYAGRPALIGQASPAVKATRCTDVEMAVAGAARG